MDERSEREPGAMKELGIRSRARRAKGMERGRSSCRHARVKKRRCAREAQAEPGGGDIILSIGSDLVSDSDSDSEPVNVIQFSYRTLKRSKFLIRTSVVSESTHCPFSVYE